MLISPGSLPIHENLFPQKYIIVPITMIIIPTAIIYFQFIIDLILIVLVLLFKSLQKCVFYKII